MSKQGDEHDDFSVMLISQKGTRMDHDRNLTSFPNKFKQEFEIPENLEHYKKESNKQLKRKTENFFDLTKDLPENIIVDWPFYPPKKLKRNIREEPEGIGKIDEDLPAQTEDNRRKKLEGKQEDNRAMNVKTNRIRRIFPNWKLPEIKKKRKKTKRKHIKNYQNQFLLKKGF